MAKRTPLVSVDHFSLEPGRVLAGKYVVESKLGGGWEGEVYKVVERQTGIKRAAKLFFPQRNVNDRAVRFYAKKLDALGRCSIVIHYVNSEVIRWKGIEVSCLISEFVDGELLSKFIKRQKGKRLESFEAMHVLYALANGIEQIHRMKEYHGDLHDGNVMIKRQGIFFDLKVVDFYHWGAPTSQHIKDDVVDMVRLLYEAVGGQRRYAAQPPEIKAICRGLRRNLITSMFPTARHLREYLETFDWTKLK